MKSKSQRSLNDLRDKATIALHADFKLDEVSPTIKATEICQNVRCTFRVQRSGLELASSVNLQNNSWYEASDDFVKKKNNHFMENARPKRRKQVPTHRG